MSELESIVLARAASAVIDAVAPTLSPAALPAAAKNLYDLAQSSTGQALISAVSALPVLAKPYLRPLTEISSPDHLPEGVTLTAQNKLDLKLTSPSPFGFDFHWLREVSTGILRGATGLRLQAAADAHLSASVSSSFLATATRESFDGQPWIRLTLNSSRGFGLDASLNAAISADAHIPLPDSPDELLHSILGVHPLQWARDAMNEIGSIRWTRIAQNCGVAPKDLEHLLTLWRTLGSKAESALWQALASDSSWNELRTWTRRLSDPAATAADFAAQLEQALLANPQFAASVPARWIEAAIGASLSAPLTQESFAALKAAAAIIEDLSIRPAVEKLMRALPLKALRELNPSDLWPWARKRLDEILGEDFPTKQFDSAIAPWVALRDRVYSGAREALAQKLSADLSILLSRSSQNNSLADASFDFSPQGLELFRQVVNGDLTCLFTQNPHIRLRHGLLTHHLRRARHIELHLPFLDRRSWQYELRSVASAEVTPNPDGSISVHYSAQATSVETRHATTQSALLFSAALSARDGETIHDNFSLSFFDTRVVSASGENDAWFSVLDAYGIPRPDLPAEPCKVTLTLSVPGRLAEAWTTAPHSRDENYVPTMCRVSRAVQSMARRWVPALYLSDISRYNTPSVVHPLLAWKCSPPYTVVKKGRYCYDFMDQKALERALTLANRTLPDELGRVRDLLTAAGRKETASYYDPSQSRYVLANVLRQRRNFTALLVADCYLVEEIIRLADCGRELRSLALSKPAAAVKNLSKYTTELVRAFHRRLNRLYANSDFVSLGSLLLVEATAALTASPNESPRISAKLTLELPTGNSVYLNEAARNDA